MFAYLIGLGRIAQISTQVLGLAVVYNFGRQLDLAYYAERERARVDRLQSLRVNTKKADIISLNQQAGLQLKLAADKDFKDKFADKSFKSADLAKAMNTWAEQIKDKKMRTVAKLIFLAAADTNTRKPEDKKVIAEVLREFTTKHQAEILDCAEAFAKILLTELMSQTYGRGDYTTSINVDLMWKLSRLPATRKHFMGYLANNPGEIETYVDDVTKYLDSEHKTILHHAAALPFRADAKHVETIVQKYPQLLEQPDQDGKTPIFYARYNAILALHKMHANLNALDKRGNSKLHYDYQAMYSYEVNNDNYWMPDDVDDRIYYKYVGPFNLLMLDLGAKCIRRGIEHKSRLQMQIAMGKDLSLDGKTDKDYDLAPEYINFQDEVGRTALQYAIINSKFDLAFKLLEADADPLITDSYGRNALHYALIANNRALVEKLLILRQPQRAKLLLPDKQRVTCLAFACYTGDKEMYNLVKKYSLPVDSKLDQLLQTYVEDPSKQLNQDAMQGLSLEERIVLIAAVSKMRYQSTAQPHPKSLTSQAYEFLKRYTPDWIPTIDHMHRLFNATTSAGLNDTAGKRFASGEAYGIEIEIANIEGVHLIPIDLALNWFNISTCIDVSVHPTLLMRLMHNNNNEMMSSILSTREQLQRFMFFTKMLHASGARVNHTTGLHVHINILGSTKELLPSVTNSMQKGLQSNEYVEVMLLKQVLTNYAAIEPLLVQFMRNGALFDHKDDGVSYSIPDINSDLEKIQRSDSYKSLISAHVLRNSSVNLMSLDKHGTVEFRFHEGSIDPTIIQAWVNLLARLMQISKQQVQAQLNAGTNNCPLIASNIEDLVYILIAERDYPKTWDNKWGAVLSASVESADTDIQAQIQQAPLYNMILMAKRGENFVEFYQKLNLSQTEGVRVLTELERMIGLMHKYPGPLDAEIDMQAFQKRLTECQQASDNVTHKKTKNESDALLDHDRFKPFFLNQTGLPS